jgi:aryl-alcohol dehydrogenase-like predicted oxidoreductase
MLGTRVGLCHPRRRTSGHHDRAGTCRQDSLLGDVQHTGLVCGQAGHSGGRAWRGVPGSIAMQYFYSLTNRDVEDEHLPVAAEFGLGFLPWSPLSFGLLSGKYDRAVVEAAATGAQRADGDKRLDGANPFGDSLFTERNWKIVDTLKQIAQEAGQTPARVALAWVTQRPGARKHVVLAGVA